MIKESMSFKLFSSAWLWLWRLYNQSLLCGVISAFLGFCRNVWDKSFASRLLFEPFGFEKSFQNGFVGRILATVSRLLAWPSSKLLNVVLSSAIVTCIGGFMNSLLVLPIKQYGSFLLTFGFAATLSMLFGGSSGGIWLYLPIIFAALGLALCFVNSSISQVLNRSYFAGLVLGFFGIDTLPGERSEKKYYVLFIILGAAMSILYTRISPLYFALGICALAGFIAVMYKTEIGVMATAFLIPIMPTMLILGVAALTVLSFAAKLVFTGSKALKSQAIDVFVILFSFMLMLSPFISYMPGSTLIVAITYLLFIAFYFVVKNTIQTKAQLFAMFSLLALSGLAVSAYGIYQQITGSYIITEAWIDVTMFEETIQRIYSTLDNPNVLGEYLLFVIAIAFSMLYYFEKLIYRIAALGILGAATVCMILCQSRGAWLGMIFALAVFVCLKDKRIIWLGIIALPLVVMLLPDSIVSRFTSIGNLADSSTSYRVNIWMASLVMLKTFWPSGIGLGTQAFEFIYQKYSYNAVFAPHSHNLFLQIIIDLGIAGLIIFVCMMTSYFKSTLVLVRQTKDKMFSALSAALCAGMAGYLLQGLTDNVWYNYRIVLYFWMILALAGALSNIAGKGAKND